MPLYVKNKKRKTAYSSLATALVVGALVLGWLDLRPSFAQSTVNQIEQISLSASLFGKDNRIIKNGTYQVRFVIYATDRATADPYPSNTDTRIWEETQEVTVKGGMFRTFLGSVTPLPASLNFETGSYYVGIRIGTDSEMVPRKKLGSVPRAINSQFLQGRSIGTKLGDIPLLGKGGKVDIKNLPTGTGPKQLVLGNDSRLGDAHQQNTDIGTDSEVFNIGSGTALSGTNFDLTVSSAATAPALRFNGTTQAWQLSNDGTTFTDIGSGSSGPITLGTDTDGNYVASVADGDGISGGSAGSEGAALTLGIDLLDSADGTGATSSNSGFEFGGAGSDELALLQGCSNGQGIAWNDTTNVWECTSFSAGLAGSGSTGYATYWSGTSALGSEAYLHPVRGGTGLDASSASNGSLLIGNGSGFSLNTLAGGTGVSVTNGSGVITLGIDATTSGTTAVTSSNSGIEATASGIRLLGGCSNDQVLAWNSGSSVWVCSNKSGGTSDWTSTGSLTYLTDVNDDLVIGGTAVDEGFVFDVSAGTLSFEGSSANGFETAIGVINPTADNAINFPDVSGTVVTTGNLTDITAVGTIASGTWNGSVIGTTYGGTGASSLNNLIALGTHTTGNYVASVGNGNGITGGATGSEGGTLTLGIDLLDSADGTGSTSNNSGLEFQGAGSNELALLQGCANNEVLSWNDGSSVWQCASVTGVGGIDGTGSANAVAYWTDSNTLTYEAELSVSRGGTGIGSYTIGDLLYASGSGTLSALADVATGNVLISGGVGIAPSWGKVNLTTAVSGTLPVGNGGTGATSLNDLITLTTHTTGNYVQSITNGSGISGGDGGSEGAALTLALGALSADWNQTGAFDISLNNASSELKILESAGATFFGIFDVADLSSADKTYTFPNASGTVITTGNLTDITTVGTVVSGTWNGTAIGAQYGGTGINTSASTGVPVISSGTWSVASQLGVAQGGTGAATLTSNGVLYGNGTSAIQATTAGTDAQLLVANGSGVPVFVSMSGDITITNAGVTTIGANTVALTTDTTGNYVASVGNGNGITGGAAGSEGATLTLGLDLLDSADGTGGTSSNSGLEFQGAGSNELALLQGCANNDVLAWVDASNTWACTSVGGVGAGDITAIGDVTSGAAFDGTQGTQLIFNDVDGDGTLTIANLSAIRTWTLPDTTGTLITTGDTGTVTGTMIADNTIEEVDFEATNSPTNGYILSYDNTTGGFTWISNTGGSGSSKFTDSGTITYLTDTTDDLAIGGSTSNASKFFFDVNTGNQIIFEGTGADDANETTLVITNPTTDKTITFADASGTVILSGHTFSSDVTGTLGSGGSTALTIASDSVALGTDTTGNYVSSATSNGGLTLTGTEGASLGILLPSATNGLSATTSSGSGLELTSSGLSLLQGCADNEVLSWDEAADVWKCNSVGGVGAGDITAVGNVTSGAAFDGTAGTELYFNDVDGDGLLTIANLSAARTYTLPDASGTVATINGGQTFTSATWNATTIAVAYGGTGATTLTSNGVLYGNGTSAIQATTAGTDAQLLVANGSGVPVFVSMSGDITITNAGVTTIGANTVALTTDTTGNYVASITAGSGVSGTVASEGATPTLDVDLLDSADGTGGTSSNSGLEFQGSGSDELTLLQGCSSNQLLLWNDSTNVWYCGSVSGAGGIDGAGATGQVAYFTDADTLSSEAELSVSRGGTGIGSYTIGDLLYASGSGTLSALADVATGNVLISGGVGIAPSWGKVNLTTAVSGTLPVGNGGTGATSLNDLITLTTHTTGNYVQSITNGSGISGGDGGSEGAALTLALGALSADWNQTGAFDISLNNASSELKILESAGATFFGIFDVADLSSADKTYTFPNVSGTVATIDGGQTFTSATWNASTLTVAYGGTGATTLTPNGVLYGNGTGAVQATSAGTNGQLLLGVSSSAPVFATMSGDATINNSGTVTIASNAVALTTDTTGNYVSSATSNGGLTLTGTEGASLGILLPAATDALSSTTSSGSGLELTSSGLSLLQGCGNNEVLSWNETSDVWACSSVSGVGGVTGTGATNQVAYWTGTSTLAGENQLSVSRGGTGAATLTSNGVLYGNGTSAIQATTAGTDAQVLVANGSGVPVFVSMSGDVTITNAGVTTIGANTVALGTDTTGNYVATLTSGNGISATATGEGSTPTIALGALSADWNQTGAFDISLNNASSELKILESAGATFFGILDAGDLSADRTYTLPDASGTVALTSDIHSAVTLSGENYLSLAGQVITANAVNLSGTNVAGTLAAARFGTLTGDVTTAGGSYATTIAADAVALGTDTTGNYVSSATSNGGLTLTGTEGASLGILLPSATDALSSSTSSGSGLELLSAGLTLLQGCANDQVLAWNETADTWACSDKTGGTSNFTDSGTVTYLTSTTDDFALGGTGVDVSSYFFDVSAGTIQFEGTSADANETTLVVTNPTADQTITFADASGTVILSGHTFSGDVTGTLGTGGTTALTIASDSVALSTDTTGNYVQSITNGSGISGGNGGSEGAALTLALGALSADWNQTGAFDISLNNASSELKILESAGATFFGIFDVADLSSADKTYTFPNASGTVITTGNLTDITTVGTVVSGTWNGTAIGAQYGGTGLNGSSAANGTLLIGNGSGYTLATLTDGTGITITEGSGTISIASTLGTDISGSEIVDGTIEEVDLEVTNSPVGGYVLTYDSGTAGFTWVDGGGLGNSKFTDSGTFTYLTNTGDDLGIGGSTLTSARYVFDVSTTGNTISFEGTGADDANETALVVTNPTGDRTITLPDSSGTVLLTGGTLLTLAGTSGSNQTISQGDTITIAAGTGITTTGGTTDTVTIASTLGTAIDTTEITDGTILEVDLNATNAPVDTYILSYDNASGGFTWISNTGGSGASKFTDSGTITYLTNTTDDLAIGGSTSNASKFFFDVNTGNQIIFEGTGADDANETTLVITNPTADRTLTLPNLTGTIATIDGAQTFTSATWNGTAIGAQYGGTGINTSASTGVPTISSGTWSVSAQLSALRGGTGVDGSAASNGTLLIGNGSGYTLANLTGTANEIGIANASGSITIGIPDDGVDFTELQDTLDLDAALVLNQSTNTWSQTFTGTTTNGFSYTANSLTTGSALVLTSTNTATTDTALSAVQFNLTNAQATNANTNGVVGASINFTNNPSVAGNTEYAFQIQNQLTSNTTDNTVAALLRLDNADTTATGTTVVTDAILITNSGGSNFTNFLNTPTLDISALGAITGATGITSSGTITFSGFTTNGGLLYTNGSGVLAQTGAGTSSGLLHGGTTPTYGDVILGTETSGNYVATLTSGNGISATATGEGSTPTIALGALSADWNQTGAFDISLNNASSELKILESAGATFFGILDAGDLSADRTLTIPDASGTILVSGGTLLTLAGTSGSNQTISQGDTITLAAGTGITTTGGATDTVTIAVSSAVPTSVSNDTNVTGSISGNVLTLGWTGQLSVSRGGTGASTLTSNGVLYGNGTSAIQATSAGTDAQVLVSVTGTPTFVSVSGDITIDNTGVTTIGADKVALGTDTTGNYVSSATANGGLTLTGTEGGSLGILLPSATDALSSTTSSGSGLELLSAGLTLLQGCANDQVLAWNETADTWACSDKTGGTSNFTDSGTVTYLTSTTDDFALGGTGVDVSAFFFDVSAGTIQFEGVSPDAFELTIAATDPTGDRTVTFADASGTVILSGHTFSSDVTGTIDTDGSTALTIASDSVALSTDTTGNYVQSITTGSGISGGDGGSEGAALTLALGALSADWNQTGAFDISLNNASSELKILESAGATFFGIFDVTDLSSADKTYTFPNASGTVITTGNLTDITATGTITSGTWNGTAIGAQYGGTGLNTSASTGVPVISSGTWSVASTIGASYITADSLDFTEFQDQLDLDDSTDILADGSEVFSITNSGSGNSFVVNDTSGDTTPFVINSGGAVGIGVAVPSYQLHVLGETALTGSSGMVLYYGSGAGLSLLNSNTPASNTVNIGSGKGLTVGSTSAAPADGIYTVGSIGIGDATPAAALTVGSGDLFQVNSSGAIAAATAITSSGTITFSGLSTAGIVTNTSGGVLGTTLSVPIANGGTNATSVGSAGSIAYSTGTAYAFSAVGTAGQALVSGGTGSPTFFTPTAGSVIFAGTSGILEQDNASFFFDNSTNRLGLGTTSPAAQLSILGSSNALRLSYDVSNYASLSTASDGTLSLTSSNTSESQFVIGTGASVDDSIGFDGASQDYYAGLDHTTGYFTIGTGFTVGSSTLLAIDSTGNIGIGTGVTAPGARLDLSLVSTNTTADTLYAQRNVLSDTGIVTTGTDTTYGVNTSVTRTGATGGTINTYGNYISVTADNAGSGTSTAYGIYSAVSGADTNYAGIFTGGNVGVGDTTPDGLLDLDSSATTTNVFGITNIGVFTGTGTSSVAQITADSATTGTLLNVSGNGLTSGKALNITSSSTAFTGNLGNFTLSGSNASNTGSLLAIDNTGTSNTNTSLYIKHYATGTNNLAFRVDDVSGDTTPFVIDGTGAVGIGTTAPTSMFELYGSGSADIVSTITAPDTTYDPIVKFRTGSSPAVQFSLGVDNSDSDKFKIYSGDGLGSGDEFVIDANGVTTIANLNLGATNFDTDAGIVSWVDMAVTGSSPSSTVESYSASIDGTSFLTIYAESDGSGGLTTTASAVKSDVQLDASADGLVTKVNAGACSDSTFNRDANGTLCVDSSNGRIYYRYGGAWHYTAQTAGFQIPNYETAPQNKLTRDAKDEQENALSFDSSNYPEYLTERMAPGEFLIPYVDEYLEDGAVHGLYARFDDVKEKLFGAEQTQIAQLTLQTNANVNTLAELQVSVDDQLVVVGNTLNSLTAKDTEVDTKLAEYDTYFANDLAHLETLDTVTSALNLGLSEQVGKTALLESQVTTLTEQVSTLLEFYTTFDMGSLVSADTEGNVSLSGKLKAKIVESEGLVIEVVDPLAPTIGTAEILPPAVDADNDGNDDYTDLPMTDADVLARDGKFVKVMTKAMIPMVKGSRIFTTFKDNPSGFSWIEKVRDEDGDYVGFKIHLSQPITDKVKVDWLLIEQKETNLP